MEARFARAQGRLHRVGSRRLADAVGRFIPAAGAPIDCVPVQYQEEVEASGPDDVLQIVPIVITYLRELAPEVTRGDRCELQRAGLHQHLRIDGVLSDDGQMLALACTEIP